MKELIMTVLLVFTFAVTAFANYPKYLYEFPETVFIGEVKGVAIYIVKWNIVDSKDMEKETPEIKIYYPNDYMVCGRAFLVKYNDKKDKILTQKELILPFTYTTENGIKRMYAKWFDEKEYLDPNSEESGAKVLINIGEALYYIKKGSPFYGFPEIPEYVYKIN